MRALILLLISGFTVSFFACKKEDTCDSTLLTPDFVFEFYYDSLNVHTNKMDTIKFTLRDTLTIYGVGAKDSLTQKNTSIQIAKLPLNFSSSSTQYVFDIKNKGIPSILTKDTLTMNYSLQREFVSQACGFKYVFPTVDYHSTQHRFQSIQVLQNEILDDKTTHIRIFF
ncbi:DUF6452 family protein [Solitalea koreensis]|uniref:Lipoprotein n=1 Tax=Solitalea koreensis TaxID=543615 RepID=A0A521BH23_9SPHI|nr:DUF6452 family protein [Solitalea koreensis]SMO46231.1 hypothetical protein SAMN06265350_102183 [Solitalea koreensis]